MIQEEEVEDLWTKMESQMKENIKEAILGKLVDEEASIRRGVAQCVSAIA